MLWSYLEPGRLAVLRGRYITEVDYSVCVLCNVTRKRKLYQIKGM